MKRSVLIACEESGTVREAFARLGWDAWSCDLLQTRIPGQHIVGDMFEALFSRAWDLVIAHPPCTALAVSGNRYYANTQARLDAIAFVERIWFDYSGPLCIENPVGVLTTMSRLPVKPQYIQPYQFGHDASKKTGLWLRGLPELVADLNDYVPGRWVNGMKRWANQTDSGQNKLAPSPTRQMERSKTYDGIARAMARQWTDYFETLDS